jgi:glycolate oxidase subunit GlcD
MIDLLKTKLKDILKPDQILDKEVDLRLYDTDATSLFKNKPALVLLPNTTEEVAQIVKAINLINNEYGKEQTCFKKSDDIHKLSFIARGAGTGLSGGAIGDKSSVIISIARLNKIINIDKTNRTAIVETGLINSALSSETKCDGLHFAPDPSSQDACTIGGNIAENAGGIHCYKHGVTSEQILGLEIVTPEGDIEYLGTLNPRSLGVNQCSLDLAKLFTGSEGTFGIATKAMVRLQSIPEAFLTIQACFDSSANAGRAVSTIIKFGFKPTAIEMIDAGAIEAVNSAYNLGLEAKIQAILLIELDGNNEEILHDASLIKEILHDENRKFNLIKYSETQDLEERKFLWKVRKGTVAAFGQIAPYWYLYDAVVPRSKIPEAMTAIEEIAKRHQLKLASVCHAADGNLHPNFLYDPDKDPTVIQRIHKASTEIMKLCIELGGVLSGEHGIGIEKQEYMPYMFSEDDLATMLNVRKIFDPQMISNSKKIFPLRICKEF